MPADERLTKNEKREQAREEARRTREQQLAKEKKRKKLIKILAVIVPIILIAVIVLAVVLNTKKENDYSQVTKPANTTELGVIVGPEKKVLTEIPMEPVASAEKAPAHVVVYQDYICPACKAFESTFATEIEEIIEEGAGVIEYRSLGFLDHLSSGTNYSSRAANASFCVANTYPEKFFDFNEVLYANQPAELTTGLSNVELGELAGSVGATGLEECISTGTHRGWIAENTKKALEVPVKGTPTIVINGKEWDKVGSLKEAVVKAGPAPAVDTASAAPSATPVATP